MSDHLYPRFAEAPLLEALADSPAVLVHGPRQCGKTTLARMVGEARGCADFTFDDEVARAAAETDPLGFIGDLPELAMLDEVQRVPRVFASLKLAFDRRRTPGRFILTSSTNVLLVPALADSLAGRMETVHLHPMAQCELSARPSRFLEGLFTTGFSATTSSASAASSPSVSRVADIPRRAGIAGILTPSCSETCVTLPASVRWTPCRGCLSS